MKGVSNWLLKNSSSWLMVGTLLLMIAVMIFVLPAQSAAADQVRDEARSPDLSFFYTPEGLAQMAGDYGIQGRQAYIQTRWSFDLLFPLVYTAFLTVGISWFINRLQVVQRFWKLVNLVPLFGGLFDILENIGTSLSMANYPKQVQAWLVLASISTPIKWILISASFILYFGLAGMLLFQKLRALKD